MAGASSEEKMILPAFRSRIRDLDVLDEEEKSDKHLLRWLRARDGDVSKAEEMIRKSVEWRRSNRIDSSLLTFRPPAFYRQRYWILMTGYDDSGCPVLIAPFWDIRPAASGQRATLVRYVDQIIYKVFTHCKSRGITQFTIVFDLQGFEWKHLKSRAAIEVILELVRNFEDNYPESLKHAIAINAPKIFTILFNLIKPLLTARTLAKVEICGMNPERWKNLLLERIPSNKLPIRYGGILREQDIPLIIDETFQPQTLSSLNSSPSASSASSAFPSSTSRNGSAGKNAEDNVNLLEAAEIPHQDEEDEATAGGEGPLQGELEWVIIEVGAGEKFDVELPVNSPQTVLRWQFNTDKNDIGFMVELRKSPKDLSLTTVVPYERHEAREGSFLCTQPGIYICTFDNTFSRFRAKLVKYFIQTLSTPRPNLNLPL